MIDLKVKKMKPKPYDKLNTTERTLLLALMMRATGGIPKDTDVEGFYVDMMKVSEVLKGE